MSATGGSVGTTEDIRVVVREKYGAIAEGKSCGCGCGCSLDDPSKGTEGQGAAVLEQIGYTAEQKAAVPEGSNLGLGCGSPLAFANAQQGETVLDLGSGAGIDCFLAAREVGRNGHVIGVDMTPAMLERARANAAKGDYANVEFRLGEIEHLPIADATVDLIISNCVVNLSPDKPQVFREALRVLKPGGRVLVSDLVLTRPLSPEQKKDVDLYVGCVAGASLREDYLGMMREAGFSKVEVVGEGRYEVGLDSLPAESSQREAFAAVTSIKVRALKQR